MLKRIAWLLLIVLVFLTLPLDRVSRWWVPQAMATCSATAGTTFNETWTTGSDPYISGGTSTAIQTWQLVQGTGSSLTSSPTVSSGSHNCGTVLELAPSSTALKLTSIGTMPYVPQSSASASHDIYWEMAWTNVTLSGTNLFIVDGVGGSGLAFGLYGASSSSTFYINGATSFTASAGTWHLFHMNNASNSTCKLQVDGGSYTTFTCLAKDFNEISVGGGGTGGPTIDIGQIYISASGYTQSAWPPSSFFDSSTGSNAGTPTATTLMSSNHGTNGGANSLAATLTGAGSDTMTWSNSHPCPTFASSLTVAGGTYTGNSGLTLDHYIGSGVSASKLVKWPIGSSYANVAVGFCMGDYYSGTTVGTDNAGFTSISVVHICDSTSSSACSGTSSFSYHLICFESLYTSTDQGCLQIDNNKLYWVTLNAVGGTTPVTDTMKVYNLNSNGTAGTLVGTVSAAEFTAWSSGGSFACGAMGNETPGVNMDQICGNVIFQYADEAFPVLPPAAPAANAMPFIATVKFPSWGAIR